MDEIKKDKRAITVSFGKKNNKEDYEDNYDYIKNMTPEELVIEITKYICKETYNT